jgi:hypothetical protein
MNGRNWAAEYHNRGFEVRPVVVETDFELPSLPKPRDAYAVKVTKRPTPPQVPAVHRPAPTTTLIVCATPARVMPSATVVPGR